jgi:hypothetical protein
MTKAHSTTSEQLRKLMQSHVELTANKREPPPQSPAAMPAAQAGTARTKSLPVMPANDALVVTRYSLRLLDSEVAKINAIIHSALEHTGQRITLTDVLRVGLSRVGESSPITRAEIGVLRASDARRTRIKS